MNKDIIQSNQYPAYILASAGTGKTELIARKVEHLIINKGVDIDRIALITFTNKATAEMVDRIKGKIYTSWQNGNTDIRKQIDKLSMAKISTMHTFCDNIIREYSNEIGLSPNYIINNLSVEKDKLANDIIKENYDEKIFTHIPMYRVVKLLKDIEEKTRDKGVELSLKEVPSISIWDDLRNYFHKIYPIYVDKLEKIKLEQATITTNDLIRYAVRILKNKKIAPYITNSLEYLFLDEAQDINFEQATLIELLIDYGVKVFVVGDEKQSIYSFRGSDKNAFYHLINYIKAHNGAMFTLDTNYRSNKFIINKVNNLFSRTFKYKNNKLNFNNQPMIAYNQAYQDNCIEIDFDNSVSEIVKKLTQNIENGKIVSYNNIVVLCRTNKEVLKVYGELRFANIPTQLYLSKSLYKSKIIIDIYKLFKYITGGGLLEKEELFYTDFYTSANALGLTEQEFYDKVDNSIKTFKQDGLRATLTENLDNFGLINYYVRNDNNQAIANIQRFNEILRDLVNDNLTDMEILDYFDIMIKAGQDESQPTTNEQNSVIVSTIHTFKGLDTGVIILNEIDNNLNKFHFADFHFNSEGLSFNKEAIAPNLNIANDIVFENNKKQIIIDNFEEEIRLMYVAMTRARDKIVLSSRKRLDKVKYQISKNKEYISYLRWIYNI